MPAFKDADRSHKRNPAPSPASRSAKFARLRAKLLTQLQISRRKDNSILEQSLSRKLLKLDRMFYAPRYKSGQGMTGWKKNPSRKKVVFYIVVIHHPMGKAYARVTKDTHGDDQFSFAMETKRDRASFLQNVATARRYAKGIARTLNYETSVETAD